MDYFPGPRPKGATTDSKLDLGMIVREIHHRLMQKGGNLSLQLDVTATHRHNNGAIFAQTVFGELMKGWGGEWRTKA